MNCSENVFLALGANEGNAEHTLNEAIHDLERVLGKMRVSSFFLTSPQGYLAQSDFINCVVSGVFEGSPNELLEQCNRIENEHGRVRVFENGPRTLDIDILLFGERVINQQDLIIPHPRMKTRKFVLVPLLELDWAIKEPFTGESYADLLDRLPVQGIYYMDLKRYSATL